MHSGTLGAAVTAASNGLPGIALSTDKRARFGFITAAEFCARNLDVLKRSMRDNTALNINVPDVPLDQVAGVRLTRFAPRSLVAIVLADDGNQPDAAAGTRRMAVSLEYDTGGVLHRQWRAQSGQTDDSDAGAIIDGFISVTVVHGGLRHVDDATVLEAWHELQ